jgi:hypothetical protein
MPTDQTPPSSAADDAANQFAAAERRLTPAAKRALAEAASRRAAHDLQTADQPKEVGGREGPDPTRYGDWEVNGITSDF